VQVEARFREELDDERGQAEHGKHGNPGEQDPSPPFRIASACGQHRQSHGQQGKQHVESDFDAQAPHLA